MTTRVRRGSGAAAAGCRRECLYGPCRRAPPRNASARDSGRRRRRQARCSRSRSERSRSPASSDGRPSASRRRISRSTSVISRFPDSVREAIPEESPVVARRTVGDDARRTAFGPSTRSLRANTRRLEVRRRRLGLIEQRPASGSPVASPPTLTTRRGLRGSTRTSRLPSDTMSSTRASSGGVVRTRPVARATRSAACGSQRVKAGDRPAVRGPPWSR